MDVDREYFMYNIFCRNKYRIELVSDNIVNEYYKYSIGILNEPHDMNMSSLLIKKTLCIVTSISNEL